MYILEEQTKELKEISETTFSEHGLKERYDLQEWIDKNPEILAKELGDEEELLIIQKEFSGFDKTNERLDLLALDKNGNLVIIENKLDDSGKDVTWQALKYVSYCSALTKDEIISIYQEYLKNKNLEDDAENNILEHLGVDYININISNSQRIILVSREFRPEVTSTVLWLRSKGVDIQCIKFIPYKFQDKIIIDIDKIIPVPEIEEFTVKLSIKDTDEKKTLTVKKHSEKIYAEYWSQLLRNSSNYNFNLYSNRTTSNASWISAGSGISHVMYNLVLLKNEMRVELYINRKSSSENKKIFNFLYEQKNIIEDKFGENLIWERLEHRRASRISYSTNQFNRDDFDNWDNAIEWHIKEMQKFEAAVKDSLEQVKNKIKIRNDVE